MFIRYKFFESKKYSIVDVSNIEEIIKSLEQNIDIIRFPITLKDSFSKELNLLLKKYPSYKYFSYRTAPDIFPKTRIYNSFYKSYLHGKISKILN